MKFLQMFVFSAIMCGTCSLECGDVQRGQEVDHTLLRYASVGKGGQLLRGPSKFELQSAECARIAIAERGYILADRHRALQISVESAPQRESHACAG